MYNNIFRVYSPTYTTVLYPKYSTVIQTFRSETFGKFTTQLSTDQSPPSRKIAKECSGFYMLSAGDYKKSRKTYT